MKVRIATFAVGSGALLLLATGCGSTSQAAGLATNPPSTPLASSSAAPSPVGLPSPTVSPTPVPPSGTPTADDSTTIELLPGELRLGGTARSGQTLPAGDLATSVSVLSALLGAPETSTSAREHCVRPGTSYVWGDSLNLFAPADGTDYETRLLRAEATGMDGRTVSLSGPEGIRVGSDISRLIDTVPASHRESYDHDGSTSTTVLVGAIAPGSTAEQGSTGVAAFTRGTVVTAIGWPVSVHSNADC